MDLYLNRPASELIFVTRSMHSKIHREIHEKCGGSEAAKEAVKEKCSIPILQFSKDGTFIKEWPSVNEAGRQLRIQNICVCLKGHRKSAGGFVWRYK